MKKDLIVLINDFPFNKGEPFFENEILALSNAFDRIFIFSVVGKRSELPTRLVPSNVICFPLNCGHNRPKYILKGIFSKDCLFNFKGKRSYKFLMSAYVLGRNSEIYRKIKQCLNKYAFEDSNVFIYSYWLTLGIASLKTRKFLEKKTNKKIRTISRCHGYDVYSEVNKYNYQPFQFEVIGLMDKIYPCSQYGTNYLIKKYPEYKNKIQTSYLSTNDNGIEQFSGLSNIKRLVTVAGFRSVKRMDLFARAFIKVVEKDSNFFWDSFGAGEDFGGVERLIKDAGILNRVKFHGNVPNSDVYRFLKENEIFFFANVSSSEGLPVSIMEATSFGIPIIATDVGGTSELVDQSNGVLLPKDIDVNELAIQIRNLANIDSGKYNELRKNSRIKWNSSFNASINLPLWICEILGK